MTEEYTYTLQDYIETFSTLHVASDQTREQTWEDITSVYEKLSQEDHDKLDATSLDLFGHHLSDLPCGWDHDWMWENVLNEIYAREQERCIVCGEINHVKWDVEKKRYVLR